MNIFRGVHDVWKLLQGSFRPREGRATATVNNHVTQHVMCHVISRDLARGVAHVILHVVWTRELD